MDMLEKKQRALNFDLYTNELRKTSELKNEIEAYKILKNEFLNFNFTHRQYSGYVSNIPVSIEEIYIFTKYLSKKYPWLKNSVKEFDVTRVEDIYSLKDIIQNPYKDFELIYTPSNLKKDKYLYSFDEPSDFINIAIDIGFINVSETKKGIEVYSDYQYIGIFDSYKEIEGNIKDLEPEIEKAVEIVLKTKNKLKEER